VGYDSHDGAEVETEWNLLALMGQPSPEGTELTIDADWRGIHGPATGLNAEYEQRGMRGELESYLVPNDTGEDSLAGRPDVDQDGTTRGFARWQHRQELNEQWDLSLEGSYVSDETFLEVFFRDEAQETRPYETSAFLRRQEEETQFSLLASGRLTDFSPQLTELQTPGFYTEKQPEAAYHRVGTDLFDGQVSWFSENRVGRVRAAFGEDAPADRGFTNGQSRALFGINANTAFEDAAMAGNFPLDWVTRADTRQELAMPLEAGPAMVTPYVAGRVTAYDQDFSDYNPEAEDQVRLWGQAGTRMGIAFYQTWAGVRSDLLGVNGVRHVVEPSVDMFVSGATVDSRALPVYDSQVEGLAEGGGVRIGVDNTLQTRRGGPGRWRREDWLALQSELVLRSGDAPTQQPLPRFFRHRPEFSRGGDHVRNQLRWMVTDTLGVTGEMTHDLEAETLAQWRVGSRLEHTPRLRTYAWYEQIEPLNSELLRYGVRYQLTAKYDIGASQTLDFGQRASREMTLTLERRLPSWRLRLRASFDEIRDEQTVSMVLIPEGLPGVSTNWLAQD
jgi:hypothetical protein